MTDTEADFDDSDDDFLNSEALIDLMECKLIFPPLFSLPTELDVITAECNNKHSLRPSNSLNYNRVIC